MGTAWASARSYPWEQGLYVGGIETAKVNLALRIYSNAWHVYAGLAILNPSARIQIDQYASSATELFKLMIRGGSGEEEERKVFRERVLWAKSVVFGDGGGEDGTGKGKKKGRRKPILLSADVLDRFSLAKMPPPPPPSDGNTSPLLPSPGPVSPPSRYRPNSHLSLLAMVDCWAHLRINPYHHLSVAATPIFRLFLGVAEHLFLSPASPSLSPSSPSPSSPSTSQPQSPLDQAIHSSLHDTWHRADDLEFVVAARGWSQCVSFGSFEVYKRRFDETRGFFEARFEEAGRLGGEMIRALMESEVEREGEEEEEEEEEEGA
jgi:prephenate dehydrogenase (NADP+)